MNDTLAEKAEDYVSSKIFPGDIAPSFNKESVREAYVAGYAQCSYEFAIKDNKTRIEEHKRLESPPDTFCNHHKSETVDRLDRLEKQMKFLDELLKNHSERISDCVINTSDVEGEVARLHQDVKELTECHTSRLDTVFEWIDTHERMIQKLHDAQKEVPWVHESLNKFHRRLRKLENKQEEK